MMIWRSLSSQTLASVLLFAIERRGRRRSAENAADPGESSGPKSVPVDVTPIGVTPAGRPAGMADRTTR